MMERVENVLLSCLLKMNKSVTTRYLFFEALQYLALI